MLAIRNDRWGINIKNLYFKHISGEFYDYFRILSTYIFCRRVFFLSVNMKEYFMITNLLLSHLALFTFRYEITKHKSESHTIYTNLLFLSIFFIVVCRSLYVTVTFFSLCTSASFHFTLGWQTHIEQCKRIVFT